MPDRFPLIPRLLLALALLCLGTHAHAVVSSVTMLTVAPVKGVPWTGNIANFVDSGGTGFPTNSAVSINWGDGTPATSTVTITASGNTANLYIIAVATPNGHTYTSAGNFTLSLTVTDPTPGSPAVPGSEPITVTPVTATGPAVMYGTTTVPAGTVIAAFADFTTSDPASLFTASINWGDGSAADPATAIVGPTSNAGPPAFIAFQVTNNNPHVYATLGVYSVVTTIFDSAGGSAQNILTFTAAINTSITLSTAPNPSSFGTPVTFTAIVTAADGSAVSGVVDFVVDGLAVRPPYSATVVTTSTVAGATTTYTNTAAFQKIDLSSGAAHSIVATYQGDTTHNQSPPSSTASQTVTPNTASLIVVATSQNPVLLTQIVTFTATVTSGNATTPTGTVSFFDTDTLLSAVPVSAGSLPSTGTAAFSSAVLTAGTHTIRATYDGGGALIPSATYNDIAQVVVDLSATGGGGGGSSRCGHGFHVGLLSLGLCAVALRRPFRRRTP